MPNRDQSFPIECKKCFVTFHNVKEVPVKRSIRSRSLWRHSWFSASQPCGFVCLIKLYHFGDMIDLLYWHQGDRGSFQRNISLCEELVVLNGSQKWFWRSKARFTGRNLLGPHSVRYLLQSLLGLFLIPFPQS